MPSRSLRVALVLLLITPDVLALVCTVCRPSLCPSPPTSCPTTLDECSCCPVCARSLNETCGGAFGLLGRCSAGLQCVTSPQHGQPIDGAQRQEGHCRPATQSGKSCPSCTFNRTHVTVAAAAEPEAEAGQLVECPADATLVHRPDTDECVCLPCPPDPSCPDNRIPVVVTAATKLPGSCCPEMRCVDQAAACAGAVCPESDSSSMVTTCPADSTSVYEPIMDGCCFRLVRCQCKEDCEEVSCSEDEDLVQIDIRNIQPGKCCPHFRCRKARAPSSCQRGQLVLADGETWSPERCSTCVCRDGVIVCSRTDCPFLQACSWMGKSDGECCQVCRGCFDENQTHAMNSTWTRSDPCQECECRNGVTSCRAFACQTRCANPRKVKGECCGVCDQEALNSALPAEHCPPLENCSLGCEFGLRLNDSGCLECACQAGCPPCPARHKALWYPRTNGVKCECIEEADPLCPQECEKRCEFGFQFDPATGCPLCACNSCPLPKSCNNTCEFGFRTDEFGCQPTCQCRASRDDVPTSLSVPGAGCLSLGRRMEDGESWHDGCRRCFCLQAREMCALITCPVPNCPAPQMDPNDCCPTCQDSNELVSEENTHCSSTDGQLHADSEFWWMDICTLCICHRGQVLCHMHSCPPLPCHHFAMPSGGCCAICRSDSTGNSTEIGDSIPGNGDAFCTSPTGAWFAEGDSWRVSACKSCVCVRGRIHCFALTCPPLRCARTVMRKGQCCPGCESVSVSRGCVHRGVHYISGQRWQDEKCVQCVCGDGHVTCTDIKCPSSQNCQRRVKLPQVCCPICHNSTGSYFSSSASSDDRRPSFVTPPRGSAMHVLVAVVALLAVFVIVLMILLLYTRRRLSLCASKSTASGLPAAASGECKLPAKPGNLEYRTGSPLVADTADQLRSLNWTATADGSRRLPIDPAKLDVFDECTQRRLPPEEDPLMCGSEPSGSSEPLVRCSATSRQPFAITNASVDDDDDDEADDEDDGTGEPLLIGNADYDDELPPPLPSAPPPFNKVRSSFFDDSDDVTEMIILNSSAGDSDGEVVESRLDAPNEDVLPRPQTTSAVKYGAEHVEIDVC